MENAIPILSDFMATPRHSPIDVQYVNYENSHCRLDSLTGFLGDGL